MGRKQSWNVMNVINHNVLLELVMANNARKEEVFVNLIKNMTFFQIIKSCAPYVLFKFLSMHIERVIDISNCLVVEKIKFDTTDNIPITNSAQLENNYVYNFDINDFEIVLFIAKLKDETIIVRQLIIHSVINNFKFYFEKSHVFFT